ncbi:hypothetical protein [Streptomyces sp. LUP47B]|nr:hypothetical protein [Streptomyces sp. LUP47B]
MNGPPFARAVDVTFVIVVLLAAVANRWDIVAALVTLGGGSVCCRK